ncbi:MAG: AMP-binding protein, partial [Mucispirillum sp.]|nr:AMP-binding protein [Mucispirillum sp.]
NIICPEEHYEYLSSKFTNHNFYKPKDYNNKLLDAEKDDAVYMLFTSGSTGVPKGIKISNLNISSYIQAFIKRNSVTNHDKIMQMNDLTFDLSIHSIFLSFICGACLYIPDSNNKINPNKFIISHKITHILMVPSTLAIMKKLRLLKSNVFQSVKYIGFCGETLPFDNAILIAEAAPNAKLENIYGPTEATIACTYFEFTKNTKELPEYAGSMPIGKAYDGMEVFLIDENLNIVNTGIGQIVLSGRQLAKGYVNNETQTKEKFIKINNKDCYLTGDLGRWVNGELVFLGRNDAQVQIRGYRVEIYEIENAISKIENIVSNAVIPTPVNGSTYENLTAFITSKGSIDTNQIKAVLAQKLPDYMVPNTYIVLDNMPLNSNGKIDRNQLKNMLQ